MKLISTIGDCNGIGIEVLAKALVLLERNSEEFNNIDYTIAGNIHTITDYLQKIGISFILSKSSITFSKKKYPVIDCSEQVEVEFGKTCAGAGRLAAASVEYATKAAIDNDCDAIITQPISKHSVSLAGWRFPGHTEMIAARCGADSPLMILCAGNIRCALATIHKPLRAVPDILSKGYLSHIFRLFHLSLMKDFGISKPRIAVLGLNPHSGEEGDIGSEEINIIIPAIELCLSEDILISYPYPADGFFAHKLYDNYDGYVAMYHDQGLIPLKLLADGGGVNFTAGLQIVRTSPAHGTAFDIAGKNQADPKSTIEAIELAIDVVNRRKESAVN
jgi:4-hydroxythreonine-4-phosphate dehydrogenase